MLSASKWPASWNWRAWIVMPSMRSWERKKCTFMLHCEKKKKTQRQYQIWLSVSVYLVSSHVCLQKCMFLLQVLDAGQVFSIVIWSQVALDLVQPQLDVLHVPVELLLLVGFTQLDAWNKKQETGFLKSQTLTLNPFLYKCIMMLLSSRLRL